MTTIKCFKLVVNHVTGCPFAWVGAACTADARRYFAARWMLPADAKIERIGGQVPKLAVGAFSEVYKLNPDGRCGTLVAR